MHLVNSKRMSELKQVHLETNKQIAHAYSTSPGRDRMDASWPGEVQAVSIYGCWSISGDVHSLCYPGTRGFCFGMTPVSFGINMGVCVVLSFTTGAWEAKIL